MDSAASIAQLRNRRTVASEQRIPAQDVWLEATLTVPLSARGIVVLPHASSAGRFERSHCFSVEVLEQAGLGTLQVDLLTPAEEASFRCENQDAAEDALLADRVLSVLEWLSNQADTSHLAVGIFTSRAVAAASLIAAERSGRAVPLATKGGIPDVVSDRMAQLSGPTLLLLGREELDRAAELAAEFFCRHLA